MLNSFITRFSIGGIRNLACSRIYHRNEMRADVKGGRRGLGVEGRRSILHGQRTIPMHEVHCRYSFLSTQNTYLHFGLCTGASLLYFNKLMAFGAMLARWSCIVLTALRFLSLGAFVIFELSLRLYLIFRA